MNNRLYILSNTGFIHAYDLNGNYDASESFQLTDLNSITSITNDGKYLYALGTPNTKILAYNTQSASRVPSHDLPTAHYTPNNPSSIHIIRDSLYYIGTEQGLTKIFKVPLSSNTAISDLTATPLKNGNIKLTWTKVINHGETHYTIKYSTPHSTNPNLTFNDKIPIDTTEITLTRLQPDTDYSFMLVSNPSNTKSNIANTKTDHPLKVGNTDLEIENTDSIPIKFFLQKEGTKSLIYVTYSNSWDISCSYTSAFSQTTKTISLTEENLNAYEKQTLIIFNNAHNDFITIHCYDKISGQKGIYPIPQIGNIPLFEQIKNFRSGEYGTKGMFSNIDLITMFILLFAMIGFNRINETVGLVITLVVFGFALYFELITFPAALFPLVGFITMIVIISTRKK